MSFSTDVSLLKCLFTITVVYLQTCSGLQNITAHPGENITLPCRASSNKTHIAVEWTRPDLTPEYIFVYVGGHFKEREQHPSFRGRVDLLDREMKEGNLSLILYNVTSNDSGTYECRVQVNDGRRRIRGVVESPPIETIKLMVTTHSGPSDVEHREEVNTNVGLIVGLSVFAALLVAGVCLVIYKPWKRCIKSSSYQPPAEQAAGPQEAELQTLRVEET